MDQSLFSTLVNRMPTFPEGSGEPKVLSLGARLFSDDKSVVRVELPLNQCFTREGDHRHGYQNAWSKVTIALIEARAEGAFAAGMDHPCDLVGHLRRWFRDNCKLYETIEENKAQVVLVIRNGAERLLVPSARIGGCTTYVPTSRWVIDVKPNEEEQS